MRIIMKNEKNDDETKEGMIRPNKTKKNMRIGMIKNKKLRKREKKQYN